MAVHVSATHVSKLTIGWTVMTQAWEDMKNEVR
jgi:hypothetical protein